MKNQVTVCTQGSCVKLHGEAAKVVETIAIITVAVGCIAIIAKLLS